jgi:serine/threonine protein phosphatase PrpC
MQYACDNLVAAAIQAGGHDNVTVIAILIETA